MPKGPNGERRPADVIGNAVLVGRIATGEIEEVPAIKSGRVRSGQIGGSVRAEKLSPERRSEVARGAANARWQKTESTTMDKKQEQQTNAQSARAVDMYPDNQLGEQVRSFEDTFRMSALLRETFFDKK